MKLCKILLLTVFTGILFSTAVFAADGSSAAEETAAYADPADYAGKTIAVATGTTTEGLLAKCFPDAVPAYYAYNADLIVAISTGKADAAFTDDVLILMSMKNDPAIRMIPVKCEPDHLAPAFPKTEKGEALAAQYNEFLAACKKSGTYEKLKEKWVSGPDEEQVFDDPSEIPDLNGTLLIGTSPASPPTQFMKNGEIVGMEVELMREFCRAYGYRPEFVSVDFAAVIVGVSTGKFDIGSSGLSVTEERKKSVLFGDPFLDINVALAVTDRNAAAKESIFTKAAEGFERTFLTENRWKMFVSGILTTVLITVLPIVLGTLIGFGLYLLCRNGDPAVNRVMGFFQWFIAGMPVVVFLMILFYVVFAKTSLSGEAVAVVGFTVLFGLTVLDMLKNSEAAIEEGQKEAAYALGYGNLETYLRIIFPQALRHMLPVYEEEVISLIKATAVAGYVAVVDITKVGDLIRGRTYDAFFPLIAVVLSYYILSGLYRAVIRAVAKMTDSRKRKKEEIMKGAVIR